MWHLLLLPLLGPLFLGFVALVYAAPFAFAIADANGRPASEWANPAHRTRWLVALGASIPLAPFIVGQCVAALYALRVPARVGSPAARAGAVTTTRRSKRAFFGSVVLYGPPWLASGWTDSDGAMLSGWAVCVAILTLCLGTTLYDTAPSVTKRAVLVAMTVFAAAGAGSVTREAWFDSCDRKCGSVESDSVWVIPAFAAAGAVAAVYATRPPKQHAQPA